ncbi:MAG: quinone-dependent dihydroorotate dehydrogenase [Candidatus Nomurabacteria bacterium]|nr:quinone-dependent dihydroorotate dehydrogenase [Candidatus Nomurabacteria bacterium]
MNLPISQLSGGIYRRILKPILFKASPDAVHHGMIRLGAGVQKVGFLRWLMRKSWAYQNPRILGQTICGVDFENPLGLSAGLDKNAEIAPVCAQIGFGQAEFGSMTFQKCAGNPRPWFYRLPKSKSIVVHVGLANDGIRANLHRLSRYSPKQMRNLRVNISVAYTNLPRQISLSEAIDDYLGSLKAIQKYRGDGKIALITLSISCPNTFGGEPFTKPDNLEKLLQKVDALEIRQPIFIKMPSDKSPIEFEKLLRVIVRHRICGVTIANLKKDRVGLKDDLPDEVQGSLSGRPTFDGSNKLIALTYKKFGKKLKISGVGGVFSADDAYAKIRAGASLVQMVTGLMFLGPQIVGKINRGLVKLLKRDGFSNVADAVGVDAGKY